MQTDEMVVSRRLSRRVWARIERRARRAHERDLLRNLRDLGRQMTPIVAIDRPRRGRGIVRIALIDRQIVLAGMSERALAVADEFTGDQVGLVLVDGGRYRGAWWLTVSDGLQRHHILGVYLRIVPHGRGSTTTPNEWSPQGRRLALATETG